MEMSAGIACGSCACCAFIALIVGFCCLATVPAGSIGIQDRFGTVFDAPLSPGLHLVGPFTDIIPLSTRLQTITYSENVPTAEGLDVHLESAAIIRLDPHAAVSIYKDIGPGYIDTVVVPQFRSVVRAVTSAHNAKDLYTSTAREAMTIGLLDDLQTALKPYGIIVQDTPLKNLELPPKLLNAIQQKLAAEQDAEKMKFVLQKQRLEAQRQEIEATGVAKYQEIVGRQINDKLLQWKGIEATQDLAKSPNAKIIMIGGSSTNGLPLMFNPDESNPLPTSSPTTPSTNQIAAAADKEL